MTETESRLRHDWKSRDMRNVWKNEDPYGTGFVPLDALQRCLPMETPLTLDEIHYLMLKYDYQKNGQFNYISFLAQDENEEILSESQRAYPPVQARSLDDDELNETLLDEKKEMKRMMIANRIRSKMYQKFTSLTDLFLHLDVYKNGVLSIDEFTSGLSTIFGMDDIDEEQVKSVLQEYLKKESSLTVTTLANFLQEPSSSKTSCYLEMEDNVSKHSNSTKDFDMKEMGSQTNGSNTPLDKDMYTALQMALEEKQIDDNMKSTTKNTSSLSQSIHYISQFLWARGQKVKVLFTSLDHHGLGFLTPGEFYTGLQKMGFHKIARSDADRIVAQFDETGSGTLEYHEFVQMMQLIYEP